MTIYASKSQKAFFDTDFCAKIPEDAQEITREYRDELLAGQSSLQKIIDWSGVTPVLTDPPPPSTEQLAAAARTRRDRLLTSTVDPINAVRWAAMTTEEQAAWIAYRQALLNVPEQTGFPTVIDWPVVPGSEEA